MLWLLRRKDQVEWDEVAAIVIATCSAPRARKLAAAECGSEGSDTWTNPQLTSCCRLPTNTREGVVLVDYRNG